MQTTTRFLTSLGESRGERLILLALMLLMLGKPAALVTLVAAWLL